MSDNQDNAQIPQEADVEPSFIPTSTDADLVSTAQNGVQPSAVAPTADPTISSVVQETIDPSAVVNVADSSLNSSNQFSQKAPDAPESKKD